jgi:phage tail-like protein
MAEDNGNDRNYPPVGFHFSVSFEESVTKNDGDTRFQNISGLSVEMDTETYREGGENRFEHSLPVKTSYANVVLQRGLMKDSKLIKWCRDTFTSLRVKPADLDIALLNEQGNRLITWKLKHAWPVKWEVTEFDAEESALVIESIELSYRYFTIDEEE